MGVGVNKFEASHPPGATRPLWYPGGGTHRPNVRQRKKRGWGACRWRGQWLGRGQEVPRNASCCGSRRVDNRSGSARAPLGVGGPAVWRRRPPADPTPRSPESQARWSGLAPGTTPQGLRHRVPGPGRPRPPGRESMRARSRPYRSRDCLGRGPAVAAVGPGRPVLSAGGTPPGLPPLPLLPGCPCPAPPAVALPPSVPRRSTRHPGSRCHGLANRGPPGFQEEARAAQPHLQAGRRTAGAAPVSPRPGRAPRTGADPVTPAPTAKHAHAVTALAPQPGPRDSVTERVPFMEPAWPRPRGSRGLRAGRPQGDGGQGGALAPLGLTRPGWHFCSLRSLA